MQTGNAVVQCMLPVSMTTLVMSSLKAVEEEDKMTPEQLAIKNVGKQVKEIFYSRLQKLCFDW